MGSFRSRKRQKLLWIPLSVPMETAHSSLAPLVYPKSDFIFLRSCITRAGHMEGYKSDC